MESSMFLLHLGLKVKNTLEKTFGKFAPLHEETPLNPSPIAACMFECTAEV